MPRPANTDLDERSTRPRSNRSETTRETDPDMAGYRRVGDRRGRLRFEIVGQAWGELEMAESRPTQRSETGETPIDTPAALSPGSAEGARQRFDDQDHDAPVGDTARTRTTVQLLDISMSGALLAAHQHVRIGRRAALRTKLGGEPFAVEIQVRHVSPNVQAARESTRFQLGVTFVSHDDRSLRCVQRFLHQKPA